MSDTIYSRFPSRHDGLPFAFFLDRARAGLACYAGSEPSSYLCVDGDGRSRRWTDGTWREEAGDPLEAIERFVEDSRADPLGAALPARFGTVPRTVGFLAYELGRWAERVPSAQGASPQGWVALLCTYDAVDARDPRTGLWRRIRLARRRKPSASPPPLAPSRMALPAAGTGCRERAHGFDRGRYEEGFERIQRAIAAGEVYQVNLCRRIAVASTAAPATVYGRMRAAQPVDHGCYLDAGGFQVLSNSPECFLRIDGSAIRSHPIKGTRGRSHDPVRDRRLGRELLDDDKENAEHVMIVDLERNDLGRVCEAGSIEVPAFRRLESFAGVHHLVSEVTGRLRAEAGLADVLRATFPGGSITGAPKIKAMEIIAEVEPAARGVYTGAVGCFNGPRSVDLNIAIRTAVAANGMLFYGTGGGIVADSRVDAEYEETVTKARVFEEAVTEPTAAASRPSPRRRSRSEAAASRAPEDAAG